MIKATFLEALMHLATALGIPLLFSCRHPKPVGNKQGCPILLIHGYFQGSMVWAYHKWRLKKAGFGPIYTIHLGNPFLSIRQYAQKVRQKAEEIQSETKRDDLILIGHSMGGLVALHYAAEMAKPNRVKGLIAIASPYRGTSAARLGIGAAPREMEIGSSFLKELHAKFEKMHSFPTLSIATKGDWIIIPYASALFGKEQYLLEPEGHDGLLISKKTADKIIEWCKRLQK